MNVLSLFDGISACHIALSRAGINVDTYFTSEIDKYATKISEYHFPNAVRLGDITKHESWDIDYSKIDIVTGGFPCQSWSVAGNQLGDKDDRGELFWVMLDVIKKVIDANSNAIFLLENVRMKAEFEQYITRHTEVALGGVEKILINSSVVSAQNRRRFYWTNIKGVYQPEDRGIVLRDIVEDIIDTGRDCELREFNYNAVCHHSATALDLRGNECLLRIYSGTGKSPTLTANGGGNREPKLLMDNLKWRKLTPLECERLQTFPDNYTLILNGDKQLVSNTQRYKVLGNAWTVDVVAHIFCFIEL